MKLVVTALHLEARIFAEGLDLRKDTASKRIPIYRGGEFSLIVSGTGKINAATATAWALEYLAHRGCGTASAVNFGICGSGDTTVPTGTVFLVNKILDFSSGRTFFPDILQAHNFPEAPLQTRDRALERSVSGNSGHVTDEATLYDLEASGFFGAAARFLPPDRISCLKIVSDHLEGRRLDKTVVADLIRARWGDIDRFLKTADASLPDPPGLSRDDDRLVDEIINTFRLTETQQHQLRDWARSYSIRFGGAALPLQKFLNREVKGKAQRNLLLVEIKHELLAT